MSVFPGKWSDVTEIVVTGPSSEPLPASRDLLSFSEGAKLASIEGILRSGAPGYQPAAISSEL